mmetsp:Transcript_13307/g.35307  ORF Transcript_13307/g.35307 Transcript_13307/m.35307 type:complete len:339 (+) Transcript_13307:1975-2991(+)
MHPSPAVAENLFQFVDRLSQSRFSRRNVSTVVPVCMYAFARTHAPWFTLERLSIASLTPLSTSRSAEFLLYRNSRRRCIGTVPDRMRSRTLACVDVVVAAAAAAPSPSTDSAAGCLTIVSTSVRTAARNGGCSASNSSNATWYATSTGSGTAASSASMLSPDGATSPASSSATPLASPRCTSMRLTARWSTSVCARCRRTSTRSSSMRNAREPAHVCAALSAYLSAAATASGEPLAFPPMADWLTAVSSASRRRQSIASPTACSVFPSSTHALSMRSTTGSMRLSMSAAAPSADVDALSAASYVACRAATYVSMHLAIKVCVNSDASDGSKSAPAESA